MLQTKIGMIFKILELFSWGIFWIVLSVFYFGRQREKCQPCFQVDPKFVSVML